MSFIISSWVSSQFVCFGTIPTQYPIDGRVWVHVLISVLGLLQRSCLFSCSLNFRFLWLFQELCSSLLQVAWKCLGLYFKRMFNPPRSAGVEAIRCKAFYFSVDSFFVSTEKIYQTLETVSSAIQTPWISSKRLRCALSFHASLFRHLDETLSRVWYITYNILILYYVRWENLIFLEAAALKPFYEVKGLRVSNENCKLFRSWIRHCPRAVLNRNITLFASLQFCYTVSID